MSIIDPSDAANPSSVAPEYGSYQTTEPTGASIPDVEQQQIPFGTIPGKISPAQLPEATQTLLGAIKQTAIIGNTARGTVTAAQAPAGANQIDRAVLNTDLTTMRDDMHTELSALHTALNDLKAKLRTAGVIDT